MEGNKLGSAVIVGPTLGREDGSLELDGPVEGKYVGSVEELGFSDGMEDGSFDIEG